MGKKRKNKNINHLIQPSNGNITQIQSESRPITWHISKTLSWTINTLVGASVYLGLASIPGATATAIPNLNLKFNRTDYTASDLMKRSTQIPCNNGTQISNWLSINTATPTPYFRMVNGAMVTAAIGPYTGSGYYRMLVNSFNQNNNPLLPFSIPVDAGTWDAGNPFIIPTESGPVFCFNTVTSSDQSFCVPYTDNLQSAGSIRNIAYYNSYNQRNPRGAGRKGGGFEVVFENDINGNTNNYQILWQGYGPDNVTPINPQEVRVSTITNSNNINGQVAVNQDNSGSIFWQQKINGINHIVKRSYDIARNFTDIKEIDLSNSTLPNYDAVNVQPVQFANSQGKLVYLAASTPGGKYNFFIQNVTFYPSFQLVGNPVNITGNQGVIFNLNTAYSVMATENNGLRITTSAPDTTASYQELIMNVNPDNTLNGNIAPIDPNNYAQLGSTIVDRGNSRFTVGYQGGTNVVFQTYSKSPLVVTPNNITINEQANNQTVSLSGFFVEQTTYQQNQITATITVAPNIMILSTIASLPANATVNYDTNTGTLTLATSGSSCQTDMNNLLCKLQGYVQAYGRTSGNMALTLTDDSGQMYNTSVPVAVVTQNFIPTVRNAYLYIGQNNRSHFIFDISTEDNVPANSLNIFLNNLNPSAANVEYVNGTVTQQGIDQYTFDKNNDVWIQHLGGNSAPQFQVSVSSYDGQQSQMINVNVFFFPTPQIITREIKYNAKSKDDRTPIPLTDSNFENINSNSPTSAQIYILDYGSHPHGGFYRKGDFDNPVTQFAQADVDNVTNPVIYFIPDGSGEQPDIKVGFSDGYNTLPIVPIDFQYTVDPASKASKVNDLVSTNQVVQYIFGLILANKSAQMFADFIRHRKNPFANFVKNAGNFGYNSFDTVSGHQFKTLIDDMVSKQGLTGEIKLNVMDYNFFRRYIPFYMTPQEKELIKFAKAYAAELGKHKEVDQFILVRWFYRFYWGFPLNASILNKGENAANVQNMVNNISTKLAGNEITVENTCLGYWKQLCGKQDESQGITLTTFNNNDKSRQSPKHDGK